jgi:hypothetical protein
MSKKEEETSSAGRDIKLCKENCKEFLSCFEKKKATHFSSILERNSLASKAFLKGTCARAFKRMGDQKINVDVDNITEVSDKNSHFKYESKVKVGSRDFVIRFRNNEASHKIESIWVATASEAAKPLSDDGEQKSTLMVMFKEGYVAESNDIEFELYVRHSQAYKVRSKRSKLAFGDEHLLTINMGKPLRELPRDKFDVALRRRYHRDKLWLVFFLIYWTVEIGVAIYAFANGRPARVLYGVDSLGNLCGQKSDIIDLSEKTRLWYANPEESNSLKLCVKECPSRNNTAIDNYVLRLLKPGGNFSSTNTILHANMPTTDLANRCLPTNGTKTILVSIIK